MSVESQGAASMEPQGRQLEEAKGYEQRSEEGELSVAPQWKLIWWAFRKHNVAMMSVFVVMAFFLIAVTAEFLAPYGLHQRFTEYIYAPPQRIRLYNEGKWIGPFVYGLKMELNLETLRREYSLDKSTVRRLGLFVKGDPYRLWDMFESDVHLFGCKGDGVAFLLGTDRLGRDVISRMIYGTRISLSIGVIGVLISFVLGLLIGGVSGYFGGTVDDVIQRVIEILRSFPRLPLWIALSAALPAELSPLKVYFAITVILSVMGWTGLARTVRGKFLALRENDYVLAARLVGASNLYIILRHLVPGFLSYLIVNLTLAIPGMILGETSLSYLGLGLRPPITSWGVLLAEAQNVNVVALYPWLLIPGIPVVVAVLVFNFVGDGLRDAADPYGE